MVYIYINTQTHISLPTRDRAHAAWDKICSSSGTKEGERKGTKGKWEGRFEGEREREREKNGEPVAGTGNAYVGSRSKDRKVNYCYYCECWKTVVARTTSRDVKRASFVILCFLFSPARPRSIFLKNKPFVATYNVVSFGKVHQWQKYPHGKMVSFMEVQIVLGSLFLSIISIELCLLWVIVRFRKYASTKIIIWFFSVEFFWLLEIRIFLEKWIFYRRYSDALARQLWKREARLPV